MDKVLITGASGMVGSLLCEKEVLDVILFDRPNDVRCSEDFLKFKNLGIKKVYHLAASTFVPRSWVDPKSYYETNTLGTLNVLEFCKAEKASLIFFSTYVYDKPHEQLINENHKIEPQNPYAHSKYLAEELCRFYALNFGVNVLVVRPFNIFGYNQGNYFLIPHIIEQVMNSDTICVKDLKPKRDYIFVEDVVDFLVSIREIKGFDVVNLGSGESHSVEEVIEIIQSVFGVSKPVVSEEETRKNEILNIQADINKLKCKYQWAPKINLESGIQKIKKNIENKDENV